MKKLKLNLDELKKTFTVLEIEELRDIKGGTYKSYSELVTAILNNTAQAGLYEFSDDGASFTFTAASTGTYQLNTHAGTAAESAVALFQSLNSSNPSVYTSTSAPSGGYGSYGSPASTTFTAPPSDCVFQCMNYIGQQLGSSLSVQAYEMSYDVQYGRIDTPGALPTYTQPSQDGVDPNNLEAFVRYHFVSSAITTLSMEQSLAAGNKLIGTINGGTHEVVIEKVFSNAVYYWDPQVQKYGAAAFGDINKVIAVSAKKGM